MDILIYFSMSIANLYLSSFILLLNDFTQSKIDLKSLFQHELKSAFLCIRVLTLKYKNEDKIKKLESIKDSP